MKSEEATTSGTAKAERAHANGSPRIEWKRIAARAKESVSGFPSNLEDRIKHDPFKTIGVVAAAGVGLGVLLGSRILRTALTSAVSYALLELTRAYIREHVPGADGAASASRR